jgi:hypothetical protein
MPKVVKVDITRAEAQLALLRELLMLMDDSFFNQLDEQTQAKILAVVVKYDPDTEEISNERLH